MSSADHKPAILESFSIVVDPRRAGSTLYSLEEILLLVISATLSNCETWLEIADFGRARVDWLRNFLPYENGSPSEDTIARVMSLLNSRQFEKGFRSWTESVKEAVGGEVTAIDGKALRGAKKRKSIRKSLTLVSAWATENRVVLGQVRVDEKSNEIEALPRLLELLELKDRHVTLDAMGCQKSIVKKIREKGADYTIALKGNQKKLAEEVEGTFSDCASIDYKSIDTSWKMTSDEGHGRKEVRTFRLLDAHDWIDTKHWAGINSIGMVTSERTKDDKTTIESRFYISSLKFTDIESFAKATRNHWHIENKLHWCLDVGFNEDKSRVRLANAAENLALVRRLSLQLLQYDKSDKRSIKRKRKLASYDLNYLEQVLLNAT